MDPHQQGMHQANGSGMDANYFVPAQQGEKGQAMAAQQPGYAPYQDGQYQHQDPQYQQYPAEYGSAPPSGYPPAESGYPAASPRPTVLGMKRGTFLAVVGLIALLLALVIGLGAGLGVSQNKLHDKENELAAVQSSLTASPTAAATQTPSATQTSASASPTPQFVNECPKSNGTVYTASTGSKQFRKFCGIDYGEGEADDLANVKVKSMDDCIDACAAKTSCEGAGWGLIEGDQGNLHSCWMKTNLTSKHHNATSDWNFAVLIESEES